MAKSKRKESNKQGKSSTNDFIVTDMQSCLKAVMQLPKSDDGLKSHRQKLQELSRMLQDSDPSIGCAACLSTIAQENGACASVKKDIAVDKDQIPSAVTKLGNFFN